MVDDPEATIVHHLATLMVWKPLRASSNHTWLIIYLLVHTDDYVKIKFYGFDILG